MNQNQSIADQIELAISRMFEAFSPYEFKASEYAIYFDKKKYSSWFIELFFRESTQLNKAIKNGTCYEIHQYLQSELATIQELKNSQYSIWFETGNYPENQEEYNIRHLALIEKVIHYQDASTLLENKVCIGCGHDFDRHQLIGFSKNEDEAPSQGWITCPEENCNCFRTWDLTTT